MEENGETESENRDKTNREREHENIENNKYDYVILGTGLVECVMAKLLSDRGKKIIQIDKNSSYGSELRTLRYTELENSLGGKIDPELLALDRKFSLDLTPKFLLADGLMKRFLCKYGLSDLVSFTPIKGSFIFKHGKLRTIPTDEKKAMMSNVVGMWQKPKMMKFFWDVRKYSELKIKNKESMYAFKRTMEEEFSSYGLNGESIEFVGHAIALNLDDSYLKLDPKITFDKIFLYVRSLLSFKECINSPYIYPLYGLSEICQAFSRKASLNGTVYMLNTPIRRIERKDDIFEIEIFNTCNKRREIVAGKYLIGEPGYFEDRVETTCEVIRCICIIKGKVEILEENVSSQVIFLSSEFKRKNDIFLAILGPEECSTPDGYMVGIISTVKETENPGREIEDIVRKLGNVKRKFLEVREVKVPSEGYENVFISKSVDQTTHFESLFGDILRIAKEVGIEEELRDVCSCVMG
ncbi:probable secretory pathway GDP dissociation inhibitor 1 [Nylanderia fulva]|uniref:probable secretory pathway GDP dissociation inhibitor 1 n=1 Tax=Nylanderia fulva TaxID=613905 RepID=UPI0010FBB022|nr:probable secretory pathway GDP dissociation inhibitor 1 [Nylanderia fulva]